MGNLFDSTGFMPHGHCYLWRPQLVVLHVASDTLIALAYFAIPALMVWFLRKRVDVPFRGVFAAFAVFIISCGTSHVMEIVTLWSPHYWASGAVKALTAVASLGTVMMLVPAMPLAVALPSPTQLKRANDQLAEAVTDLQLHQLVLQQMRLGVVLVRTRDGVVVFANPRAEHLLGVTAGALTGVSVRALLVNQADVGPAFGADSNHDGAERELPLTWRDHEGNPVWTLATLGSVDHPVHGQVRFARLRDVGDVERSLMVDIVRSTIEAVVAVDLAGTVRTWNPGAERLYGYTAAEAVGQPFEALTGAVAQYPVGDGALVHDAQHRTKDGHLKDVVVTVSPVPLPGGERRGISKLIHDVSERRQAERALAASLQEKEVLLQEVHHRVKNNLQLVSSLLSLQSDAEKHEGSRASLVELQGRVRAIAMMHEVLYQSTSLAHVALEDSMHRLLSSVARIHQRPGMTSTLRVSAPGLALKMESSVPLALVLNELFVNAFKHGFTAAAAPVELSIRAQHEGDVVRIEVDDNGTGLGEGFTLEARAGVGLRLVQSLIRQLRGTLQTSTVARGTRWIITLPSEVLAS